MTTHKTPPRGEGLTPCCNRTVFELPEDDLITLVAEDVTCPEPRNGKRKAGDVTYRSAAIPGVAGWFPCCNLCGALTSEPELHTTWHVNAD